MTGEGDVPAARPRTREPAAASSSAAASCWPRPVARRPSGTAPSAARWPRSSRACRCGRSAWTIPSSTRSTTSRNCKAKHGKPQPLEGITHRRPARRALLAGRPERHRPHPGLLLLRRQRDHQRRADQRQHPGLCADVLTPMPCRANPRQLTRPPLGGSPAPVCWRRRRWRRWRVATAPVETAHVGRSRSSSAATRPAGSCRAAARRTSRADCCGAARYRRQSARPTADVICRRRRRRAGRDVRHTTG